MAKHVLIGAEIERENSLPYEGAVAFTHLSSAGSEQPAQRARR